MGLIHHLWIGGGLERVDGEELVWGRGLVGWGDGGGLKGFLLMSSGVMMVFSFLLLLHQQQQH